MNSSREMGGFQPEATHVPLRSNAQWEVIALFFPDRYHIDAVIPTRINQPPDPNFDKKMHRRRNIIERVVGWFGECWALGTRYDKLAVSYVALWVVANIHYLLKKLLRFLKTGLSERT